MALLLSIQSQSIVYTSLYSSFYGVIGEMKFKIDGTVGRLGKWLRVLGYDTDYIKRPINVNDYKEITDDTILITKKRIYKASPSNILVLRSDSLRDQLMELNRFFPISTSHPHKFKRCIKCNALLKKVSREEVEGLVPDYIHSSNTEFNQCPQCGRVYWPGTHRERMMRFIKELERVL